jgi:hypothetical protein
LLAKSFLQTETKAAKQKFILSAKLNSGLATSMKIWFVKKI